MLSKKLKKIKILLLLNASLIISSCASTSNYKVYTGCSIYDGICRSQDKELIKCSDKAIDEYFCIKKDDFEKALIKCGNKKCLLF